MEGNSRFPYAIDAAVQLLLQTCFLAHRCRRPRRCRPRRYRPGRCCCKTNGQNQVYSLYLNGPHLWGFALMTSIRLQRAIWGEERGEGREVCVCV